MQSQSNTNPNVFECPARFANRINEIMATTRLPRKREGYLRVANSDHSRRDMLETLGRCIESALAEGAEKYQSHRELAKRAYAYFMDANGWYYQRQTQGDVIDNRLSDIEGTISSMCYDNEGFTCYF